MSKEKTFEEKKNDFKDYVLKLEQDLIMSSDPADSQQVVNKIVKHFNEVEPEMVEEK